MPSTRTPGTAYARPLMAMVGDAVCFAVGTLIDQPLFCTTTTAGSLKTAAKLSALWKSGSLVPPSPEKPSATERAPRSFIAHAQPTACGTCVAMFDDHDTWWTIFADGWLGICRPLSTSAELPKTCATKLSSGKPRTSIVACSRRAGNTQSSCSTTRPVAMGVASCPCAEP